MPEQNLTHICKAPLRKIAFKNTNHSLPLDLAAIIKSKIMNTKDKSAKEVANWMQNTFVYCMRGETRNNSIIILSGNVSVVD